ncbi:Uncharacterised protein [BD1-7 clade bacterium]|uniref:Uncharacterized protein n=1 Tax=BD1-7 clade bacterium TaxID=2029982 RepID=A0A5S9NKF8_9GAMM|nr:Uncharacterised protein [BD1-7 clade bacterium]CAA0093491.1 Uncharacterised protein [BD1-7 clade bacterium]
MIVWPCSCEPISPKGTLKQENPPTTPPPLIHKAFYSKIVCLLGHPLFCGQPTDPK